LRLASRVKTILNERLDGAPLDVKPQIIDVATRDGRCFNLRVDYPKGNPKNPVTSDELVQSFRSMAGYAAKPLARTSIDRTIEMVLDLEKVQDVAGIARLLSA
jgi:2-methylcitrate dehydratase PrpD